MVDNGFYDADKIVEVDEIALSPAGLIGHLDDEAILHGHHRGHPNKTQQHRPRSFLANRLLSIGFTSHYAMMTDHFGTASLGCAAEDLIVACEQRIALSDLRGGVAIRRSGRTLVELADAEPAQPCVPFTKYMLGTESTTDRIVESMEALRDGIRGFVFGIPSLETDVVVRTGDEVWTRS
jgi:hypothetical protein